MTAINTNQPQQAPGLPGFSSGVQRLAIMLSSLIFAACSSSSGDGTISPTTLPPPPPATNTAPVAEAGADQAASTSLPVGLDGSASMDADGDSIAYSWSFASMPAGSLSTLDDDTAARPVFTPDIPGDYVLELVVSDGSDNSLADQVTIAASDNSVSQRVGAGGGDVISGDGLMTLSIPPGALMTDEEITITFVPPDQHGSYLGSEWDEIVEFQSVYDLRPDGLTFVTPITVEFASPENPVIDVNTMGGALQFLLTSDGAAVELLEEMTIFADAERASTVVSGKLGHFSPMVFEQAEIYKEYGMTWQITGVPDELFLSETRTVRATADSSFLNLDQAAYREKDNEPPFRREDERPVTVQMERQGDSNSFALEIDYDCWNVGTADYDPTILVDISEDPRLAWLSKQLIVVDAKKFVRCRNAEEPEPSSRLTPGTRQAPGGLTQLEAFQIGQLLNTIVLSGTGDVSAHPIALFTGALGNILYDASEGTVLRDATDPDRTEPVFGAVLASSELPDGETAGTIYQFGGGNFGGRRCDYDPAIENFGDFCQLGSGTGYDAVPVGNSHETPQIAYATVFEVGVIQLDENTGFYDFGPFPTANDAFFGTPVSAVRANLTGPLLVITRGSGFSEIYLVDPDGTATPVDTLFDEEFRKVRCEGTMCVITLRNDITGEGALRLVIWDGFNGATVVETTIPVGDTPVTPGMLRLSNGNFLIGSTGFDDNTVTLTEVTPNGAEVFNNTAPVPDVCLQPGHTGFYQPSDVPEEAQLVGTCYGAPWWWVLDMTNEGGDGFRIVPLE